MKNMIFFGLYILIWFLVFVIGFAMFTGDGVTVSIDGVKHTIKIGSR
jgi:hypothetical protein